MNQAAESIPAMPTFLSDIYRAVKEDKQQVTTGGKRRKTRKNKKRKYTRKMYRGGL